MSDIVSNLAFSPNLTHSIFSAKLVNRTYFGTIDWVIDTGTTDHMVHSVSCFTIIIATLNTHVNLPNGEVALVTHIGTVKINENLILYNVLCVPSFSFNLILVSQLAKFVLCCLILVTCASSRTLLIGAHLVWVKSATASTCWKIAIQSLLLF